MEDGTGHAPCDVKHLASEQPRIGGSCGGRECFLLVTMMPGDAFLARFFVVVRGPDSESVLGLMSRFFGDQRCSCSSALAAWCVLLLADVMSDGERIGAPSKLRVSCLMQIDARWRHTHGVMAQHTVGVIHDAALRNAWC